MSTRALCRRGSEAGFTLIEVMVAIMLMALVSLIAWRGLDSISRAQSHLEVSTEQTAQLLRALNQIKRDMDMRATTELLSPIETSSGPTPAALALPAAVQLKSGRRGAPTLEVIRNAPGHPGALQRVRWWVEGNTLYRATAQPSTHYPLPAPRNVVPVLDQVTDFSIRFWEPGKGWRNLPAAGMEEPAGVEVRVSRRGMRGGEEYRVVVQLASHPQ